MKYELYHDESKVGGYWHGILLVPVDKKQTLLQFLAEARNNAKYFNPLGIKKVKNETGPIYNCAFAWVGIAVAALVSQAKGLPLPVLSGQRVKGKPQFMHMQQLIGAKFIVFREKDNLSKMSDLLDYGSKVETTFRMGLKGGLHYLGNNTDPIFIDKMHFDGYEHQSRHLDQARIVDRLQGLRSYCAIANRPDLIDDRSSNHTRANSQSYDDCQLLQLTDILVGCFRSVLERPTRPAHKKLAYPVESITERYFGGHARMQNSRWKDSFCLSQCYLEAGSWRFATIGIEPENTQLRLI